MNCSVDGAPAGYPSAARPSTATGYTRACTAWNNAATRRETQRRDQARADPYRRGAAIGDLRGRIRRSDAALVDSSDSESGVTGGQLEMRPATGGSWTPVTTQFDGQHLLARFDDAKRKGPYLFRATSCDAVGNCASSTSTLTLPVRLASTSSVSFHPINDPGEARIVRQRVRFTSQWTTLRAAPHADAPHARWPVEDHSLGSSAHPRHPAGDWQPAPLATGERRPETTTWSHPDRARTVRPAGHHLRAADNRRPGADRRSADAHPLGTRQRHRRLHPDGGRDDRCHRALGGDTARGAITHHRSALQRLPNDPPGGWTGADNRARQDKADQHLPPAVPWGGTVRIVGELDGGYLPPGGALVRLRIGPAPPAPPTASGNT